MEAYENNNPGEAGFGTGGPEGPPEDSKREVGNKGFLAGFGAVLLLLLGKLKYLLLILKFGKFGGTLISMVLMIWAYAAMSPLWFAVGFVLLLLVHETGHYLEAKRVGLPVSAPIFIPFLGAFITMKQHPSDVVTEARIALAGPIAGIGVSLLVGATGLALGNGILLGLAYSGLMLNLFNLIPVHPLDGGRVTGAVSPLLWRFGLVVLVVFAVVFFNPLMMLVLILVGFQAYQSWKNPMPASYYEIPDQLRTIFGLAYFSLLALAGGGMWYIHMLTGR